MDEERSDLTYEYPAAVVMQRARENRAMYERLAAAEARIKALTEALEALLRLVENDMRPEQEATQRGADRITVVSDPMEAARATLAATRVEER
jgi:hypothetical protein